MQADPRLPDIGSARLIPLSNRLSRLPYWAIVTALLGVIIAWSMATNERYEVIFQAISAGLRLTVFVTIIAYAGALALGLLVVLGRISRNIVIQQISTFYVEIIRGVPTLVLLLYIAFVVIPAAVDGLNKLGIPIRLRDINDVARVIVALMIAYSAFIAEIFRAGVAAVDRGQMEAARALGMTYWQAMYHVILPQAFRIVVPPLGNDFIAMLKDSSLVSALGVADITLLGKVYAASTFLTFETYNVVAFLYLTMTLLLSGVVKWLENALARERRIA